MTEQSEVTAGLYSIPRILIAPSPEDIYAVICLPRDINAVLILLPGHQLRLDLTTTGHQRPMLIRHKDAATYEHHRHTGEDAYTAALLTADPHWANTPAGHQLCHPEMLDLPEQETT